MPEAAGIVDIVTLQTSTHRFFLQWVAHDVLIMKATGDKIMATLKEVMKTMKGGTARVSR
jgi:hypothetical protein